MRIRKGVYVFIGFVVCACRAYAGMEWNDIGQGTTDVFSVLIQEDKPENIFWGGSKGIFKTEDSGMNWQRVLSIQGGNRKVNHLNFSFGDTHKIYAATGNGLFFSPDSGKIWHRIFKGKNYLENNCLYIEACPHALFLGTEAGLFISRDKGVHWQRETSKIGNVSVVSIACVKDQQECGIFAAAYSGIFKSSDDGKSWFSVFSSRHTEAVVDGEERPDNSDAETDGVVIRCLVVRRKNPSHILAGTNKGLLISEDRGSTWNQFPDTGLLDRDILSIAESRDGVVYIATRKGIFFLCDYRWEQVSDGLESLGVRQIVLDNKRVIFAAADKGIFRGREKIATGLIQEKLTQDIGCGEVTISEVQNAAIKYAEVEIEKIKTWRKQAAKRAFLPKVSAGMDKDIDRTTSNTVWGTYGSNGSPGKHYVGPDDETRYRNLNWSVAVSWDLGDLIWNDAQTSIDVRSKLMEHLCPALINRCPT
ncbi:MAG: hypothetical protein PHE58_03515 [Candidatus Omnitrophica bacterium]|nr:hypothetical protein [Candidatus Omnitrophota bacterium]